MIPDVLQAKPITTFPEASLTVGREEGHERDVTGGSPNPVQNRNAL